MKNAVTTTKAKKKILLARAGAAALPPVTAMAFGNGGTGADGTVTAPDEGQGSLKNEICRKEITKYEIVSDTQVRYYCRIGESELAGMGISELALVDAEGDLVSIRNFRTKEKDDDFSFTFIVNDTM